MMTVSLMEFRSPLILIAFAKGSLLLIFLVISRSSIITTHVKQLFSYQTLKWEHEALSCGKEGWLGTQIFDKVKKCWAKLGGVDRKDSGAGSS